MPAYAADRLLFNACSLLFLSNVGDDMSNLFRADPGQGGHITKSTVMLPDPFSDRPVIGKIGMSCRPVHIVNQRRPLVTTQCIIAMAGCAVLLKQYFPLRGIADKVFGREMIGVGADLHSLFQTLAFTCCQQQRKHQYQRHFEQAVSRPQWSGGRICQRV